MRMVQVPSLLHPFQFSDLVVTVLGSCNQLELFAQDCSMICWPKGAGKCTKVKQHEHLMQNEVQVLQGFLRVLAGFVFAVASTRCPIASPSLSKWSC